MKSTTTSGKIEQKCTGRQNTGRKTMVGDNRSLVEQTFNQKWDGTELGRKGTGALKRKAW